MQNTLLTVMFTQLLSCNTYILRRYALIFNDVPFCIRAYWLLSLLITIYIYGHNPCYAFTPEINDFYVMLAETSTFESRDDSEPGTGRRFVHRCACPVLRARSHVVCHPALL